MPILLHRPECRQPDRAPIGADSRPQRLGVIVAADVIRPGDPDPVSPEPTIDDPMVAVDVRLAHAPQYRLRHDEQGLALVAIDTARPTGTTRFVAPAALAPAELGDAARERVAQALAEVVLGAQR